MVQTQQSSPDQLLNGLVPYFGCSILCLPLRGCLCDFPLLLESWEWSQVGKLLSNRKLFRPGLDPLQAVPATAFWISSWAVSFSQSQFWWNLDRIAQTWKPSLLCVAKERLCSSQSQRLVPRSRYQVLIPFLRDLSFPSIAFSLRFLFRGDPCYFAAQKVVDLFCPYQAQYPIELELGFVCLFASQANLFLFK